MKRNKENSPKLVPYNEKKWHMIFPVPPNNEYNKLLMSDVGLYSISKPAMTLELELFLKEQIKLVYGHNIAHDLICTETNGGLGGFSTMLCKIFKHVNIVEIEALHAHIIKNNLSVYGVQNFEVIKDNYLNTDLQQDIIISDPPWGGLKYYEQKELNLFIGDKNVIDVINDASKNKRFKIFILLVPKNYDFRSFFQKCVCHQINIRKLQNHFFISIINKI